MGLPKKIGACVGVFPGPGPAAAVLQSQEWEEAELIHSRAPPTPPRAAGRQLRPEGAWHPQSWIQNLRGRIKGYETSIEIFDI